MQTEYLSRFNSFKRLNNKEKKNAGKTGFMQTDVFVIRLNAVQTISVEN